MNRQTIFDKMTIDLLLAAKTDEVHIRIHELAVKYGIEERFVREKLVELHANKLIRLSAYHETGAVKPLEEWPDSEFFFSYASDGNYKRVRLLLRGAEFLEKLSTSDEPEMQKRAIGFHC